MAGNRPLMVSKFAVQVRNLSDRAAPQADNTADTKVRRLLFEAPSESCGLDLRKEDHELNLIESLGHFPTVAMFDYSWDEYCFVISTTDDYTTVGNEIRF
jgi:hypothetical protein